MDRIFGQLKLNWKAGLSVALVNIPMSLSLAIASGGAPTTGIVTAIWAGLIAALIGGSFFNIVGPAGALSGILASYALLYGAAVLPIIAIVSGVIILIAWFFRLDRYIVFIPSSVIHGFTLAVAITIGFGQLNSSFGLKGLTPHDTFVKNLIESLAHIGSTVPSTFTLFLIGLAILFTLAKFFPKAPATVLVAVLGIGVGYASSKGILPYSFDTIFTKFGNISLHLFQMPNFGNNAFNMTVIKAAPLVAIVTILETLLSAKVADGMTKTKFRQRREVLGIGLANIGSGLFGGLPATGVFARTALNIRSGAVSNYSAIINALLVALISLVLLPGFSFLPMATVASILVFLAFRMVAAEHFIKLYKFDKTACGLSFVVAVLCVVYDPLIGILAGSAISLLFFVNYLSKAQGELVVGTVSGDMTDLELEKFDSSKGVNLQKMGGNTVMYRFVGELNYMNAEMHKSAIEKVNGDHYVVFNFESLFYVDIDGLDAIDEMIESLELRGKDVYVCGASSYIESLFAKKAWFSQKMVQGHLFKNQIETFGYIGGKTKTA